MFMDSEKNVFFSQNQIVSSFKWTFVKFQEDTGCCLDDDDDDDDDIVNESM